MADYMDDITTAMRSFNVDMIRL